MENNKTIKPNVKSETMRRLLNKKILLGILAIITAAIFIGITSFVPFIITKEKLMSEKFWTDELIIIAITIFAMVSVMYVGQASNAQNPKSQIATSKVEFKASIQRIDNINSFSQWVKRVLQPNDIQSIKERELRRIGIDDYTVLKLTDAEIIELSKNPQKYNNRYYSQISSKQAKFILDLKDGVKRIHLVEPEYYLTVSSIETDHTDSEKSGRENLKKNLKLFVSITSKIIVTLIPAMIFAALARDLNSEEISKAQAWATFISRIMALLSSSFMGYIVGCQINDIDAEYIGLRVGVHSKYVQDTEFVPVSQQEIAKKEFVERVKAENKQYAHSLELKDREETKNKTGE